MLIVQEMLRKVIFEKLLTCDLKYDEKNCMNSSHQMWCNPPNKQRKQIYKRLSVKSVFYRT
jgi:hypothetical protein